MDTTVYVDGFNLYYGALKNTAYKWINLKLLAEQLVPAEYKITKIKYFTARVSGASNPESPKKQQIYLSALGTISELEIHFGSFLSKTIRRPTVNVPIANLPISTVPEVTLPEGNWDVQFSSGPRLLTVGRFRPLNGGRQGQAPIPPANAIHTEVHTMEEKGSDVNLAAHLLNDAWKDAYKAAIVISNDTDLVAPIRMVSIERKKIVFIVSPGKFGVSKPLANVATYQRHIRTSMLAASQFPIQIPGTTIRKPAVW